MATIQNERDKILQAAPVRFEPPPLPQEVQDAVDAVKGIQIVSSGSQFKVSGSATTPASISFTIRFSLISGTVSWAVVQGDATLSVSGNAATLTPAGMVTDRVRIRAAITVAGVTYTDELDVSRVRDGTNGNPGSPGAPGNPGVRGTVHAYAWIAAAAWNATAANNAITTLTGSSTRIVGDLVTLYNQTAGWAETRYWTGSVWQFLEQVIDGNLVVTGTLSFGKLTGGEATFTNFSGQVAIGQGTAGIGISRTVPGNYNQTCLYVADYHNGTADNAPVWVIAPNRPRTVRLQGFTNSQSWGFAYPVLRVAAVDTSGGTLSVVADFETNKTAAVTVQAKNTGSNTQGNVATNSNAFYAASGTYGPFTGSHEAAIDPADAAGQGDIVVDAELLHADSLIDTFHRVERSGEAWQAGAVGVLVRRQAFGAHVPAAYRWPDDEYDPAFDAVKAQYEMAVIAAVGEGQISVCGQGGDISKGDLIACSDMPGKGMRQDDGVVRACTVAKARCAVTFDHPEQVKLVPCIYLCG